MNNPFIGTIIEFGGNFAPRGWALCDGQVLDINSHNALFAILGTTYGGDGRTTFRLPDLRGRIAIHAGNGPGLSDRRLGQETGSETNLIAANQLPAHSHTVTPAVGGAADTDDPINAFISPREEDSFAAAASTALMGGTPTSNTGGNIPLNNMAPFSVVNYIIALEGIFPSRS